jgi:hypothetical protein
MRLAAHAASRATVSAMCTRSTEVSKVVLMTAKTSGDSSPGVSHDIFREIQDSFTTQGLRDSGPKRPNPGPGFSPVREAPAPPDRNPIRRVGMV